MSFRPLIAVQGGCGDIPDSRVQPKLDGVRRSIRAGYAVLLGKETADSYLPSDLSSSSEMSEAMKAVVSAVTIMENDAAFNAGYGSVLNEDGNIEMEAIVMEGKNLNSGAVTCIENVANPIHVACKVMTATPHCLLAGEGANRFATKMGFNIIKQESLITPHAKKALEIFNQNKDFLKLGNDETVEDPDEKVFSTVGAVAIDRFGNLAAATSTGGRTGKMAGRVGDTPTIGAGIFADNTVGAVSTTGVGECLMKTSVAKKMVENLAKCEDASRAIRSAVDEMKMKVGGQAGAVLITPEGQIGVEFNSKRMAWAKVDAEGNVHSGCNQGEDFVEKF